VTANPKSGLKSPRAGSGQSQIVLFGGTPKAPLSRDREGAVLKGGTEFRAGK
jgi:hypothetical protein